jgi:hypothetical protein
MALHIGLQHPNTQTYGSARLCCRRRGLRCIHVSIGAPITLKLLQEALAFLGPFVQYFPVGFGSDGFWGL